jgi:hypothetical protein
MADVDFMKCCELQHRILHRRVATAPVGLPDKKSLQYKLGSRKVRQRGPWLEDGASIAMPTNII